VLVVKSTSGEARLGRQVRLRRGDIMIVGEGPVEVPVRGLCRSMIGMQVQVEGGDSDEPCGYPKPTKIVKYEAKVQQFAP
jgi:hypothetical protein